MRLQALSFAALVFCLSPALADDSADAKAIVAKALKESGAKADDKPVLLTWKEKGTFTGGGIKMPYTSEWAYQGPDKYRFKVNGEFMGMKVEILVLVNGKKAWESAFGDAHEMTGEKLDATLNEVYQFHVLSLAPLLNDKEFKLTTAGEKDVDNKKTVGVKVAHERKPAITLYFDKATGLLSKSEMTVKDEFQGWKEVPEETYFDDYKDVGGRKYFTKMRVVRDGNTMIESALSDQKAPEKLDAKLFEIPAK
jgi:outer membrane lipoprotein-sorting protein